MSFYRIFSIHVVALVVTCSLGIPAFAETALAAKLASIDIGNFGRVNDTYYRGALPENDDYADLAALGVKTIIDLTESDGDADEPRMVKTAGMTLVDIPMTTHEPPTPEQLELFLAIVTDSAKQPVYVHCVGGRHRTGVMTALYRMTHDGWTPDQAFQEMKQYKFGADFLHPEFKKFVYAFPKQRLRVSRAQGAARVSVRTAS